MLVGKEESVGPISAVLSHGYCTKKIAFFEHVYNSNLNHIFYHSDSCCHRFNLWGIEILKRENVCLQI